VDGRFILPGIDLLRAFLPLICPADSRFSFCFDEVGLLAACGPAEMKELA
jgi:hypothetical protein